MKATVIRRAAVALGSGALLATAWAGPVAAQTPADVSAKASGEVWCGFNHDACEQKRLTYKHYGYSVSPLYWAGRDNTCVPETSCNGYWFKWWD